MAGREHTLDTRKVHHKWDKRNPPAIEIEPGDTVHCETAEVTNNQLTPGCPASALGQLDFSQLYPLAGPIYVRGAEPGDILAVDILRLEPLTWGWAGLIPGLGLLAEDFSQPYIRHFDLSNGLTTPLRDDIHIPIQPFCGSPDPERDRGRRRDSVCRRAGVAGGAHSARGRIGRESPGRVVLRSDPGGGAFADSRPRRRPRPDARTRMSWL
jgi:hypothetical protein